MKTCKKCGKQGDPSEFLKDANVCRDCNKLYMKNYYKSHRDIAIAYVKKYRETHKEQIQKWYEKNKDYRKSYSQIYNKLHKEQRKQWYKEHKYQQAQNCHNWEIENHLRRYKLSYQRRMEEKISVLTHYGNGKCACIKCGFDDIRALSIDHINGGGTNHRKSIIHIYNWLIKNNFPEGYQTLCMNCQFIKKATEGHFIYIDHPTVKKGIYYRQLFLDL